MTSATSSVPTLTPLATLSSPTVTRAWQSIPHPHTPLLATATADKSVAIWSLRDLRLLSTITGGHKRSVRSVAWKDTGPPTRSYVGGPVEIKPGGIVLATGSFDSNTGIWSKNDRKVKRGGGGEEFGLENAGTEEGDGDVDADGEEEEQEEWAFSSLLTGPDSEIKSVAFSPTNPALLATSSRDKSVWVWEDVAESNSNAAEGGYGGFGGGEEAEYETVAVLAEHTGDVKCVAWHPGREVLASGSYDDTVRLWRDVEEEGDWCCVGVLEGHEGTVWGVAWEPLKQGEEGEYVEPRLASCSDDLTIRIWRNVTEQKKLERMAGNGPRMPSIIRPASSMESWVQEVAFPQMHVRSIYAIAWSSVTGLLVSCGGDGGIYVYKETPKLKPDSHTTINSDGGDATMTNGTSSEPEPDPVSSSQPQWPETEWIVVAQVEAAHAEFEINHVCWAKRQDHDKRRDDEEVIVSSGDDGLVRVWVLPDELLSGARG